jgi:hypothetical protein
MVFKTLVFDDVQASTRFVSTIRLLSSYQGRSDQFFNKTLVIMQFGYKRD